MKIIFSEYIQSLIQIIKDVVTILFYIIGAIVAIIGLKNWSREIKGNYEFDLAIRLGKAINEFFRLFKTIRTDLVKLLSYEKKPEITNLEIIKEIVVNIDKKTDDLLRRFVESYNSLKAVEIEARVIWKEKNIIDLFDLYHISFTSFMMSLNYFKIQYYGKDEQKGKIELSSKELFEQDYLMNIFYLPPEKILVKNLYKLKETNNSIENELEKNNEGVFSFLQKYF